jgi:hypothetical protein
MREFVSESYIPRYQQKHPHQGTRAWRKTMSPHTTIPARAAAGTGTAAMKRSKSGLARAGLTLGVLTMAAAGPVLAGAGPAAAAVPAVLYAAAAAAGTGDCSAAADACTLQSALGHAEPGTVIELVTPGGTAHYVGNWTVHGGGDGAPVTIEAAPGVSNPVLDGGGQTGPSGPVLNVLANSYVALTGITIANGYNNGQGLEGNPGGGGGLANAGNVTITDSTFTGNYASHGGGAIDNGDGSNGGTGSVTVTASTFTGNTAGQSAPPVAGDGGAIDNGDNNGGGSVTVTASTFTGNTAGAGEAIDNGGGTADRTGGSVTVTASTFAGNTPADGDAIYSGLYGLVTVTASTFAGGGGAIYDGGITQVAGDLFDGSCVGAVGIDGGYNAGTDTSCFASGQNTDIHFAAVGQDLQKALTDNGGPTQTIEPTTGNPAIGLIPTDTTVTLGVNQVALCPAPDQRGYPSADYTNCDAGAVQTTGSPPLTLTGSAAPASFAQAGQKITYTYTVTNPFRTNDSGAGTLTGITVTDPAVPGVSCPAGSLSPGSSETCTGSYTTTAKDLAAGTITATATATGVTLDGVPVTSKPSTVIVERAAWPPVLDGFCQPAAHAAEAYYLGVEGDTVGPVGNRWQLLVTHPGTAKVTFTGTITINAGTFSHLTHVHLGTGDSAHITGKTLTFQITDNGAVKGIRFATSFKTAKITVTLNINGQPATVNQIGLGSYASGVGTGSPLTFTR